MSLDQNKSDTSITHKKSEVLPCFRTLEELLHSFDDAFLPLDAKQSSVRNALLGLQAVKQLVIKRANMHPGPPLRESAMHWLWILLTLVVLSEKLEDIHPKPCDYHGRKQLIRSSLDQ